LPPKRLPRRKKNRESTVVKNIPLSARSHIGFARIFQAHQKGAVGQLNRARESLDFERAEHYQKRADAAHERVLSEVQKARLILEEANAPLTERKQKQRLKKN